MGLEAKKTTMDKQSIAPAAFGHESLKTLRTIDYSKAKITSTSNAQSITPVYSKELLKFRRYTTLVKCYADVNN